MYMMITDRYLRQRQTVKTGFDIAMKAVRNIYNDRTA